VCRSRTINTAFRSIARSKNCRSSGCLMCGFSIRLPKLRERIGLRIDVRDLDARSRRRRHAELHEVLAHRHVSLTQLRRVLRLELLQLHDRVDRVDELLVVQPRDRLLQLRDQRVGVAFLRTRRLRFPRTGSSTGRAPRRRRATASSRARGGRPCGAIPRARRRRGPRAESADPSADPARRRRRRADRRGSSPRAGAAVRISGCDHPSATCQASEIPGDDDRRDAQERHTHLERGVMSARTPPA
jgi:hypothetical protein